MSRIIGSAGAGGGVTMDFNARLYFGRFVALATGKITTIRGYIVYSGAVYGDDGKCAFAIYSDNAGTPDSRLATSSELTFATSGAKSAEFDLDITLDTYYWLAVACNHSAFLQSWDSGGTHKQLALGESYPYSFPASAPSSWTGTGSYEYLLSGLALDVGSPIFAYAQQ